MNNQQVTQRILYSGRVQGVGFRWTANRIAAGFPLTGFVRNLADGQVELIAQGIESAIAAFTEELRSAMLNNIDYESVELVADSESFASFTIRR